MGIQAKDRQDQLFEFRINQGQLLLALSLALCGTAPEMREAESMLLDFASDPLTARIIRRAISDELASGNELLTKVVTTAERSLQPRLALQQARA